MAHWASWYSTWAEICRQKQQQWSGQDNTDTHLFCRNRWAMSRLSGKSICLVGVCRRCWAVHQYICEGYPAIYGSRNLVRIRCVFMTLLPSFLCRRIIRSWRFGVLLAFFDPRISVLSQLYLEKMIEDSWYFVWFSQSLLRFTSQMHSSHGDISKIMGQKANSWEIKMCDRRGHNCCRNRELQWLSGFEDNFAHEVADTFFLVDTKALELGGGGNEAVQKIVIVVLLRVVDIFLVVILAGDADGSLCFEEFLF